MNKHALLIGLAAALAFGVGSAGAQNLSAAPKMTGVKRTANIGQPPPPPVMESCQSKPDGTVECTHKHCEDVGSNMPPLCITYTFTRDNYEP